MDYSVRMAVARAALGFRLHTGWAAVVAAAGQPGKIEVLLRSRIELLPPDGSIPRFVYHEAAALDASGAAALVKRAASASRGARPVDAGGAAARVDRDRVAQKP